MSVSAPFDTETAPRPVRPRFTLSTGGLLALVILGTFVVHEAAHWGMGSILGYQMSYGLNGSVPASPTSPGEHALISIAGPVVTVLQAVIALWVLRTDRGVTAYAFLFAATFMRVVAQGLSLILPNDEARVSVWLGMGFWTLPLLVSAALIGCTIWAARRLQLSWRFNGLAYVVASLTVSAIVGADTLMRE